MGVIFELEEMVYQPVLEILLINNRFMLDMTMLDLVPDLLVGIQMRGMFWQEEDPNAIAGVRTNARTCFERWKEA